MKRRGFFKSVMGGLLGVFGLGQSSLVARRGGCNYSVGDDYTGWTMIRAPKRQTKHFADGSSLSWTARNKENVRDAIERSLNGLQRYKLDLGDA